MLANRDHGEKAKKDVVVFCCFVFCVFVLLPGCESLCVQEMTLYRENLFCALCDMANWPGSDNATNGLKK